MLVLGFDDSLCHKRGLTIYGTGMRHDPLISSRKRVQVSWGHDWVILSLLIPNPPWSPTKVWALPVGMRLYRNRQGLTKGKPKEKGPGKGAKANSGANSGVRSEFRCQGTFSRGGRPRRRGSRTMPRRWEMTSTQSSAPEGRPLRTDDRTPSNS